MTLDQKRVLRELLNQCISHGFDCSYPLKPIADKLGIPEPLYDNNTNTGLLWEFGPYGSGLIFAHGDWPDSDASIRFDDAHMIENWTHIPTGGKSLSMYSAYLDVPGTFNTKYPPGSPEHASAGWQPN